VILHPDLECPARVPTHPPRTGSSGPTCPAKCRRPDRADPERRSSWREICAEPMKHCLKEIADRVLGERQ
jgi:hypothetical protein